MTPVIFDRHTWHYWLAHEWGGLWRDNTDICSYVRRVLWGLLKLTVVCLALLVAYVGAGLMLGDMLAWIGAGLLHGWVEPESLARAALTAVAVVTGFAALFGVLFVWVEYGHVLTNKLPERDAFIPEAYRSFKDRVCFRVEIR